ncbi:TPA: CopG family transcriptional regulator [Clostridium perfringens]|uniref:hypothetical protein n=1 Tax=Clostridium perfringens TaxID=1502 RepID=UPI00024961F1|nr:hypothetical protein [Clostridium perfringens]EHP45038.1 hypothetical protein HMPREF9476_03105 [Clostridium perfringens WAL-14572]EJT6559980.1 CopG family transcriptional regulator [Clostridium perfringens]MBI6111797.1 CopG family transcriptional regulator [Clostridium perfringens]MBI6114859.1 CopG family transcriptional regulator [Clostridium perfringens]MDH5078453.1 hypothetical protein [Clostridium perfringens]
MARVVKTVSLNDETDKDLIAKLESVPNISDYIKGLIAADIRENSLFTKDQKAEIKRLILKVLNDENFIKDNSVKADKDQLDAIDELFNA